jgi:hypothetical protein
MFNKAMGAPQIGARGAYYRKNGKKLDFDAARHPGCPVIDDSSLMGRSGLLCPSGHAREQGFPGFKSFAGKPAPTG